MKVFSLTGLLAILSISVSGCGGGAANVKPSSATLGSPMSNFCASERSCPGISKAMFEVCGSCDPTTRYFRQSMCSLDEKLRTAIDSCVKGQTGLSVKGKDIFGATVTGCVKQKLVNEPKMVETFTAIAKKHKATESEQKAWKDSCDKLWSAHQARKAGGTDKRDDTDKTDTADKTDGK